MGDSGGAVDPAPPPRSRVIKGRNGGGTVTSALQQASAGGARRDRLAVEEQQKPVLTVQVDGDVAAGGRSGAFARVPIPPPIHRLCTPCDHARRAAAEAKVTFNSARRSLDKACMTIPAGAGNGPQPQQAAICGCGCGARVPLTPGPLAIWAIILH